MQEIRFDDIAGLEAAVSEEFGAFGPEKIVTQEMIDQFAELTGDHQWIHVDVERAKKESPFGGPIAHGFFTLALVPALRPGRTFAVTGHASAVNYGSDGFRFLAPVPSGSAVQARSRLAAVVAKPKGTLVTTETAVHVTGHETPSLLYKGLTLYRPPKG